MALHSLSFSVRGPRGLARLLVVMPIAVSLVACKPEQPETTASTNTCAANLYASYDAKNLDQCVNACIRCDRGTTTTCTTSCTLKGAH